MVRGYLCTALLCLVAMGFLPAMEAQDYNVVCYYGSWAQDRSGDGQLTSSNINASLCSHLIYAFVDLQNDAITLLSQQPRFDEFVATKTRNPDLKVMLAIGGWTAGVTQFRATAQSASRTQAFAQDAIRFLRLHGFDGLDLDWEYPGQRGGDARDKIHFTSFIKIIYQAFQNEVIQSGQQRLLLSAAVYAFPYMFDSYELDKIGDYLDFINIMTYDLEGSWTRIAGFNAPLPDVVVAVDQYVDAGLPRSKLHMGLASYGHTWRLADPSQVLPDSRSTGPGDPGPYTVQSGILAYYEICTFLRTRGWVRGWWGPSSCPYAYSGFQYVGYDDLESLQYKVGHITSQGLGGAMVWSVELDDFNDMCETGRFPLLTGINQMLNGNFTLPSTASPLPTQSTPKLCRRTFDHSSFCARADTSDGNYRNPEDCHQFFTCLGGLNRGKQSCPPTLAFNERANACDYEDNVPECQTDLLCTTTASSSETRKPASTTRTSVTTAPPTTPPPTTTTAPPPPPSTTSRLTTADTGPLSQFCVGKTPGNYIYTQDCHYFVQCTGVPAGVLNQCPANLAFDGTLCDWENRVTRCNDGSVTTPAPLPDEVKCPSSGYHYLRDPTDCAAYFVCWNGRKYSARCSFPLRFDIVYKSCDYHWNVDCSGVQP